jgi:glycosyltransferase involved in cell wall biosynthesis
MSGPVGPDDGPRGRLLVVSHACVLPVNQHVYARLLALGWDVTLIVPEHWSHEYERDPFESRALPELEGRLVKVPTLLAGRPQRHVYRRRASKMLRTFAPVAAFIEEETFSLSGLQWGMAAARAQVPFGVQADENLDRSLPAIARAARRQTLRHAAFVAARSPTAGELARRWGARGNLALVPHAVPEWEPLRRNPDRPFTVGFAGRLVPEKGIHDLVQAVAGLDAPMRLLLVGDGPLRPELERTRLPNGEIAIWTDIGHGEMPRAYAEMDVLVLPSRTTERWAEQFGRVLVESLWCGVPVVGSDSGEIPWVISQTGGGRIFPEGDVERMTSILSELRARPREREELARKGREAAEKLFSVGAAATALDDALLSVVALGAEASPSSRAWRPGMQLAEGGTRR